MKTRTINFTIFLGASSKNCKDLHSSNSFWKLGLCCGIFWNIDKLRALFQFLHLSFNPIHRAVLTQNMVITQGANGITSGGSKKMLSLLFIPSHLAR